MNKLRIALSMALVAMVSPAFAEGDSQWIKHASSMLDNLTAGLVSIGIPVIGLGVICLALWAGVSGKIEWMRVGIIIIAGLLLTTGPGLVKSLFGA